MRGAGTSAIGVPVSLEGHGLDGLGEVGRPRTGQIDQGAWQICSALGEEDEFIGALIVRVRGLADVAKRVGPRGSSGIVGHQPEQRCRQSPRVVVGSSSSVWRYS